MTNHLRYLILTVVLSMLLGGSSALRMIRDTQYPFTTTGAVFAMGNQSILSTGPTNYFPGQDARVKITISSLRSRQGWGSTKLMGPLINITAHVARVVIIPAYSGRARTGTMTPCWSISQAALSTAGTSNTYYWQQYWGMGTMPRVDNQLRWRNGLSATAYTTFTVPPFPFRICVQLAYMLRNGTIVNRTSHSTDRMWGEIDNFRTTVFNTHTYIPYVFVAASTMYEGDYAAIKILQNRRPHNTYAASPSGNVYDGDAIKLVPAGFPCTYETGNGKYCGTKNAAGVWTETTCPDQGSVRYGVAALGDNRANPYSMKWNGYRITSGTYPQASLQLIAYMKLPAPATYDMCYSPREMRKNSPRNSTVVPAWFKVFAMDSSCTSVGASINIQPSCASTTRLTIAANTDTLRWTTADWFPGSWGTIQMYSTDAAAKPFNLGKATAWEYSSPAEFFAIAGGDQFRLVDEDAFAAGAEMTYGNLDTRSATGAKLSTISQKPFGASAFSTPQRTTAAVGSFGASGDTYIQTMQGDPNRGTRFAITDGLASGGCWNNYNDNFGNYGKGLNGINSGMTTSCCTDATVDNDWTCATGGSQNTRCAMSDQDSRGVTASGDLGDNPRSGMFSWAWDTASAASAYAYVRIPQGRRWKVCYRRAGTSGGTENWREITGTATELGNLLNPNAPTRRMRKNYTYHLNDTREFTWGPITITEATWRNAQVAAKPSLTTQDLNYWSTAPTVVGSAVKIVRSTRSCYTDAGETDTFTMRAGVRECEVGQCPSSTCTLPCAAGSSHESSELRTEIVFYIRIPKKISTYYRVCFKNGAENWIQLHDPRARKLLGDTVSSPWNFRPYLASPLSITLNDRRQGTWGKFLIGRTTDGYTKALNINPNNAYGAGDVFRIVQNGTRHSNPAYCDVTWGATDARGIMQSFTPGWTVWNLGVWCSANGATASTTRCGASFVAPTSGGQIGTYPYIDIDSTTDASILTSVNEGAVAFLTLPARITSVPAGYRLCYKQIGMNWQDVFLGTGQNPMIIAAPMGISASAKTIDGASSLLAGSYGYIDLTGGTIHLDFDLVKLVLDTAGGCDRAAAGTQSPGNAYISFSWRRLSSSTWSENNRGGQALVSSTAVSTAQASLSGTAARGIATGGARAYMVYPTTSTMSTAAVNYKVCYMNRTSGSSDQQNWQHLSTISVAGNGMAYTVDQQPFNGGVIGIKFLAAAGVLLNTNPDGDSAKVVQITDACLSSEWGSTNRPSGITSAHQGLEITAEVMGIPSVSSSMQEAGITDLGPSNLLITPTATMITTLPYASVDSEVTYKVCYRRKGMAWTEVELAPMAQQQYLLSSKQFTTITRTAHGGPLPQSFTINSKLYGVDPYTGASHGGLNYTTMVIGGISTTDYGSSNTSNFFITYSSAFDSYAQDSWKLVQYARETVPGQNQTIPEANCRSPGIMMGNPGFGSSTTAPAITINMPIPGGRYMVCYQKVGTNAWLQMKPTSGSTNPFPIIPTPLSFIYSSATGNTTVTDAFTLNYNSLATAVGALSPNDQIYMINSTDTCGMAHGWGWPYVSTQTMANAAKLFGTSNVTLQASTPVPTSAAPGWYKLCYYRSSTQGMNSIKTYTPIGWYQIMNAGSGTNGGGSPFYLTVSANRLRILNCPRFNSTYPLRTGMSFDVTVQVLDNLNMPMSFSVGTYANMITAVAVPSADQTTYALQNVRGSCMPATAPTFGWLSSNLRQWTLSGAVTFSLTVTSACPAKETTCSFTFAASDNIKSPGVGATNSRTDPSQCTISVRPTKTNALGISSATSTCILGTTCAITVADYHTDGGLAHTVTTDIMAQVSDSFATSGLTVSMNQVSMSSTFTKVGTISQGFFSATVAFDVTSGSLFAADTRVTFNFKADNQNVTYTMIVQRPMMKKVHIVDLYPTASLAVTGMRESDRFIRTNMAPSWEPSTGYFMGAFEDGSSAITAASEFHLIAQQMYTVILRAVDQNGRYMTNANLITAQQVTIVPTNSFPSKNAIIAMCDRQEVCVTPFSSVTMSQPQIAITFGVKNMCSRSNPCTLSFKFGGADPIDAPTTITTPVRGVATSLSATCYPGSTFTGTGSSTCASTTVEKGVSLRVTAIDQFGDTDEFFSGSFLPILRGGNGYTTPNGINITTVTALASGGSATVSPMAFSQGVATITGLTLSRPCTSGCNLQVITNWGTNILDMGAFVVTPSTVKLNCELSAATRAKLYACSVDSAGACSTVSGQFNFDKNTPSSNANALIYKDTVMCATITAVNGDTTPIPTLYETNWVMYWAQALAVTGTTIVPVTLADAGTGAGAAPTRVKAMTRSAVEFCFRVSATTKASFRINFAAQRFNDNPYWATTSGTCSLGDFTVWPQKHVAQLVVTAATNPMTSLDTLPLSNARLYAQRADVSSTALTSSISFGTQDHYGSIIQTSEMMSTISLNSVVIQSCSLDSSGALSSCTTSALGSSSTITMNEPTTSDQRHGGIAQVSLSGQASIVLTGQVVYPLTFSNWCLGCYISFKIKSSSGDYATRTLSGTSYTPSATVQLFILMPSGGISRMVAFRYGTSPWNGYWQQFQEGALSPSSSQPVIFKQSCFTSDKGICSPKEQYFLPTMCDPQTTAGSDLIYAGSSTPIQMFVINSVSSDALTTTGEINCGTQNTCALAQVDILNSYAISASIGSQTLSCSGGAACNNDMSTSPSQNVLGYGNTVADAIRAFAGSAPLESATSYRSTEFTLRGVYPSNYYVLTSGGLMSKDNDKPSYFGAFVASASTNSTGVTTTPTSWSTGNYQFIFKGPRPAQTFEILDTAADTACFSEPTYWCHSTSSASSCFYDGYEKYSKLSGINYEYAWTSGTMSSIIPVGTYVPISAEVRDANGKRVATAAGTVTIAVASWQGCNNGGTLTVRGAVGNSVSLDNGRITAWISFSAPCQMCVLSFTLTPSSAQSELYTTLNTNVGQLTRMTKRIQVQDNNAGSATHLIVTLPKPNGVLPNSAITVADTISLTMLPTRAIGGTSGALAVADPSATGSAYAYNSLATTASNWAWFGNGGVLRTDRNGNSYAHHQVRATFANAAASAISFMFTRTCTNGCTATIVYTINGYRGLSFRVKSQSSTGIIGTTFTVTTASTQYILVGLRPRRIATGKDFGVSLWHMGSELPDTIPIAGVGSRTSTAIGAQMSADDSSNGDGGKFTETVFLADRSEMHRISIPATCNRCKLSFSTDDMFINVFTTATMLRIQQNPTTGTGYFAMHPMTTQYFSYDIFAIDNLGFIDVYQGGFSSTANPCFAYNPMECPSSFATAIGCSISSGPTSFPIAETYFTAAGVSTCMMSTTNNMMTNGKATNVQMQLTGPVREGYPVFSVNSVMNSAPWTRATSFDISVGTTGLNLATKVDRFTVNIQSPVTVQVGLVKSTTIGSGVAYSYIAVEATNQVIATLSGCPPLIASSSTTSTTLTKGYGTLRFAFSTPTTSSSQCIVTITAQPGSGSCAKPEQCTTTLSAITVSSMTLNKWFWIAPSVMDNTPGLPAGPYFGAVGRTSYFRIGLLGTGVDSTPIVLKTCDDPSTTAVEQCTFTVTTDSTCTTPPSIGAATFSTETGMAEIPVTWPAAQTAGPYTCKLQVTVLDGRGATLTVDGNPGASPTITVCKPTRMILTTNTSTMFTRDYAITGMPYSISLSVLDDIGRHCRGDSQDMATEIKAELYTNERTPTLVTSMAIYNTNKTTSAVKTWTPATISTAKVVAGSATFELRFTNSTVNLGINGVKIRFTSTSGLPAGQTPIDSAPARSVIAAQMLRFSPQSVMPRWWVKMRPMQTTFKDQIIAQAVDSVDRAFAPNAPNIARRTAEIGNAERVTWTITPMPVSGFPMQFSTGAKEQSLSSGEATYGFTWISDDGEYDLSMRSLTPNSRIAPAPNHRITFQSIRRIFIDSRGYTRTSGICDSGCFLPNTTFMYNATGDFLNASQISGFNVSVFLADDARNAVRGDNMSWIRVQMVKSATSTASVRLSQPDAYTTQGPFWARVTQGIATFSLGFLGSTLEKGSTNPDNHTAVTLQFDCPATVPASVTGTTQIANPCALSTLIAPAVSTRNIRIYDYSVPQTTWQSAEVAGQAPIIKVSLKLTDLSQFNATQFAATLAGALSSSFPFITPANSGSVIKITGCVVDRTYFGPTLDFGSNVCGAAGLCSGSNTVCPLGIVKCICPSTTALNTLLSRYLLQSTNAVQTQTTFNLQNANGFSATSAGKITSIYAALSQATANAFKTNTDLISAFGIDTSTVSAISASSPTTVATNTPAPPTSAPPTGGNYNTPFPTPASASAVRAVLTLLVAAVLMLLL